MPCPFPVVQTHPQTHSDIPPTHPSLRFLSETGLLDLPEAVGQLLSLQALTLTQNALRDLPQTLANLTKLQALLLNNNVRVSAGVDVG